MPREVGSTATRTHAELQNTQCAAPRMTQNPQDGIQMVLPLPPSYEEALQTSAPDGSNSTVAFGFTNCNKNENVSVRTISLPPSYEDVILNTDYSTVRIDDVLHV